MLKLKRTISNLEVAVDDLEARIMKKRTEIKGVIKNSRTKAKYLLRQMKHLDADLEKKLGQLENLRQVLDSIQDVQDNKKIIETLKIAKNALHEEVKDQDVDKIQDLVDDIKNLVEQLLSHGYGVAGVIICMALFVSSHLKLRNV